MRTEEWIDWIEHVTTRPSMWIQPGTYDNVVAFLAGYDLALQGAFLAGFDEWLAMRYRRAHNMAWSGMIRREVIPNVDEAELSDGQQSELLLALRQLLVEFMQHRKEVGLRSIYHEYEKWLKRRRNAAPLPDRYQRPGA
ncbi:hypothetical protein [Blastopirellula marina]|uniref:Uncharacterized protein n=1 Tax=Blastopirellula marina TaxID=124 RepID=A0A2S8GCB7_9BACT|nr:hypothetical protein [Blastopirellula marina]PQO42079.1 hypothetical protein C5Y93_27400 [Blastopirellula marina]